MPKINEAMQTLTAQWYNAMVTGLGLSDQQFQIYQGPASLVTTSKQMWGLFDAVPPFSVNNYYDPSQVNNLSSDYGLILSALVASSDTSFQTCMGDYYTAWQTYFAANPPQTWDAKGISDLFQKWAMMNAPSKASCVTALTKIFIDPINIAINKYSAAGGQYAWNKTIDDLQTALAGGAGRSFSLDSKTGSSSLSHTWANGGTSVVFDIFSFGGNASYDQLSTKVISSGLTIKASFQKVTSFAAGPLATADSNNPILAGYKPWYESAALAKAYTTKDNTVWNNQSPITWDKAFGSNGFLQRLASSVVAADGISVKIQSNASFTSDEQKTITAAASGGFWPFFTANAGGGTTSHAHFDDNGIFSADVDIPAGNPQILGILQTPLSQIF